MGNLLASRDELFDIVLDIDDTLVYSDTRTSKPDIMLRFSDSRRMDTYRLIPAALPFLVTILASLPDCRLSFYSAGEEQRNILLVDQLMEMVRRELSTRSGKGSSLSWMRPTKPVILSRQHVDRLGRKDLLMVHRSLSLDRAILIDDNMTALREHRDNLIQITPPHAPLRRSASAKYRDEARSRSNKCLVFALGKILYCYDKWKHENVSVPTSIKHFAACEGQRRDSAEAAGSPLDSSRLPPDTADAPAASEHSSADEMSIFYELGLQEIRKYYPDFEVADGAP